MRSVHRDGELAAPPAASGHDVCDGGVGASVDRDPQEVDRQRDRLG
jgi:hypothetical protein